MCLFGFSGIYAQSGIRPQIWSNFYVGWNINEQWALRNLVSFNVLLSKDKPWNEVTYNITCVYKFHRFFEASEGVYVAGVKQNENLRSYEYRPHIGFRAATNTLKK